MIRAVGTHMGRSENCPKCDAQIHTKGMGGGAWRLEAVGGPEFITIEVQTHPGMIGNRITQIKLDRFGKLIEVKPQ